MQEKGYSGFVRPVMVVHSIFGSSPLPLPGMPLFKLALVLFQIL